MCCLAGCSKTAPRILIFLIAIGADYSYEVKNSEIWAPAFFKVNGLDWQCYLAGSSKTAPRILIFLIAMGAYYSFEVKNIEIWAPAFFKHNNSFIATV